MKDVFIIYTHHGDTGVAIRISQFLSSKGLTVFFDDTNIKAGKDWRKEEEEWMKNTQKVVFILSDSCFTEDGSIREELVFELDCADRFQKPVIPIVLGKASQKLSSWIEARWGRKTQIIVESVLDERHLNKLYASISDGLIKTEEINSFFKIVLNAQQGDLNAQMQLGEYFEYGKPIEQNYLQAILWYELSAHLGNRDAMFAVGNCYLKLASEIHDFLEAPSPYDPISSYAGMPLYDADKIIKYIKQIASVDTNKRAVGDKAEYWFCRVGEKEPHDFKGLIMLLTSDIYKHSLHYLDGFIFSCIPSDDALNVIERYGLLADKKQQYQLCSILYSFTQVNGIIVTDDNPSDAIVKQDSRIQQVALRSITILTRWAEQNNIHAILFCASCFHNLNPNTIDTDHYKQLKKGNKTVSYLNQAYRQLGNDVLRYNLADYCFREDKKLSDRLLGQDNPNPLGVLLKMIGLQFCPYNCESWLETTIANEIWPEREALYICGLACAHINLSVTAKYLRKASVLGLNSARIALGDFLIEHFEMITCGEINLVGSCQNIDWYRDALGEEGLKDEKIGAPIELRYFNSYRASKLLFDNGKEACRLYEEAGDNRRIGRLYYWGVGFDENREFAKTLGYDGSVAGTEETEFVTRVNSMKSSLEEIAFHNEAAQAMAEADEYSEIVNYPTEYHEESIDYNSADDDKLDWDDFTKEMKDKKKEWETDYPDIPCPYDIFFAQNLKK